MMTRPLILLAGLSVTAGWLGVPAFGAVFADWVHFGTIHHEPYSYGFAAISVVGALAGIFVGYRLYARWRERDPLRALGPGYTLLERKYYLDDIYLGGIVRPIQYGVARGVDWTNQNILDGVVNAAGWLAKKLALGVDQVDRKAVDGAVNGVAIGTGATGGLLRYIQSGNVQRYAVFLFVGVAILAILITRF
jgi:NADH-quinone oxidoreductase subunit L